MSRSVELVFRLRTEGQAEAEALKRKVAELGGEVVTASPKVAAWDKANRALTEGLKQSGPAVDLAQSAIGRVAAAAGPAAVAAAGLSAGLLAVTAASVEITAALAATNREVVQLGSRMGLTVEQTQRLQATARVGGLEMGTLESAADGLARRLRENSAEGARAESTLRTLQVATRDASGEELGRGQVLLGLLEKLRDVRGESERYTIAQQALGKDAANDLRPLLGSLVAIEEVVRRLPAGFDDGLSKQLTEADRLIAGLDLSWQRFTNSLKAKIATITIPVLIRLTDTANGNDDPFADEIDALVGTGTNARNAARNRAARGPGDPQDYNVFRDAQRAQAAAHFRASFAETEDGRRQRLAVVKSERERLRQTLFSDDLDVANRPGLQKQLQDLTAEQTRLEASLRKVSDHLKQRSEQFTRLLDSLEEKGLDPFTRFLVDFENRLQAFTRANGPLSTQEISDTTFAFRDAAGRERRRLLPVAPLPDVDQRTQRFLYGSVVRPAVEDQVQVNPNRFLLSGDQAREIAVQGRQQATDVALRRMQASVRPGDEITAIERATAIRIDGVRRVQQIEADTMLNRLKADLEILRIRQEGEIAIAELQQRKINEYRDTAGRVWDSLRSRGGGGVMDFLRGQGDILQRQLFVNASEKAFTAAGATLGRVGQATGLGSLLKGTIFDPQNAQVAVKLNTSATESNTTALRENTAAISAAASGDLAGSSALGDYNVFRDFAGAGGAGGLISDVNGIAGQGSRVLSRIGLRSASSRVSSILSGAGSVFSGGLFAGLKSGGYSIQTGDGTARVASGFERAGNIAGSAALLAGSAYGVVSGIREGGARGAVTAIGSALGAASAIPGPQQGVLQAAALVAGLVRGLFPDPKKEREEAIRRTIEQNRYDEPQARNRSIDLAGNDLDYDKRGNARPIVVNVQTLDAKSFMDRRQDIAQAVHGALVDGTSDLPDSIRMISANV